MSVVAPIPADQAPLLARPFYAGGDPGPIAATLAHVPELMEVTLPFVSTALSPSAVDARTKEIVIVRTSAILGCRYCVDTHTPVAIDAGLTVDEVRSLRMEPGPGVDEVFGSERERALVAWTDEVAGGRGRVQADLTRALRTHVSDHELVELTVLVGATMLLNRYATALELPVSAGTLARLGAAGFETGS
jgi:AhpD family alkylhydroperoxidase